MSGIGSGENGQLTFLDTIAFISFIVGILNFEENLTQSDKQDLLEEFNDKASYLLTEIHTHLEEQDHKLDKIIELLEGANKNG